MSDRETAAGHRADRSPHDDIRHDVVSGKRAKDADVRESARRPATQGKPDARALDGTSLFGSFNATVTVARSPPQGLEHGNDLGPA